MFTVFQYSQCVASNGTQQVDFSCGVISFGVFPRIVFVFCSAIANDLKLGVIVFVFVQYFHQPITRRCPTPQHTLPCLALNRGERAPGIQQYSARVCPRSF